MKIYIFSVILASAILLAANYPKSSTQVFPFSQEHLKSIREELREKKYLDSLGVIEEGCKENLKKGSDFIQNSPKFAYFVSKIKKGKVPFKKWFEHEWLGNPQLADRKVAFSRWETAATYPRSWYGRIWYSFEENLQRTSSDEEKWLMIFIKYYRNAELIEKLFETYEPQIYKTITQKEFVQGNLKECFEELLKAHEVIVQNPNYKNEFEKLKSAEKGVLNAYFFKMAFPDYKKKLREESIIMIRSRAVSWFYSFWYRRYTEGNMEVVYKIIYKVYWHYQNQRESIFE